MSFEWIIFSIIILHFLIGFGWLFYKLEIEKDKKKEVNGNKNDIVK